MDSITNIFIIVFAFAAFIVLMRFTETFGKENLRRNIPEQQIVSRWTAFLVDQANADSEFLELVEAELDARNSPFTYDRGKFIAHSNPNPFIRVKLNYTFSCIIGFEKVGKDMQINWAIREKHSLLYRVPIIGPPLHRWYYVTKFLDQNRLLAFSTFTKSCTENAVDSLMDKYDLDKTKLVRQPSGKLGPL